MWHAQTPVSKEKPPNHSVSPNWLDTAYTYPIVDTTLVKHDHLDVKLVSLTQWQTEQTSISDFSQIGYKSSYNIQIKDPY